MNASASAPTFNGGKITILVGRAVNKNAMQVFRADLAAIKVGRAAIGTVSGTPALVIQPRTDYTKSNPAYVEFYQHGLDVTVLSTRFGTKLLLAIAASMRA